MPQRSIALVNAVNEFLTIHANLLELRKRGQTERLRQEFEQASGMSIVPSSFQELLSRFRINNNIALKRAANPYYHPRSSSASFTAVFAKNGWG
jgi:hypothetical protein